MGGGRRLWSFLCTSIYNEVLPVWSPVAPKYGGISFDSADIGVLNIVGMGVVTLWQVRVPRACSLFVLLLQLV